jgi:hypothetical protein
MNNLRTFLALLIGALAGCSTNGPITGRQYADLAVRPSDISYVIANDPGSYHFGRYTLVEQFPAPTAFNAGMSSHVAFEQLGMATGMEMNIHSNPNAKDALKFPQDVPIEWRTTAYWALARKRADGMIETIDISVRFVKLTRYKTEIPTVGSPFFRGTDNGWFIDQVNALPTVHNPKSGIKGR